MRMRIACAAAAVVLLSAGWAGADEPIKRTLLQRFNVPGSVYETVIGVAEIAPNAMIGRHTHAGTEAGYVIDGELLLMV